MTLSDIERILTEDGIIDVEDVPTSELKLKTLKAGWCFNISIDGHRTRILLGLREDFPLSLPEYFVLNYSDCPFIPHVEKNGRVCYVQNDSVFIDSDRPDDVIKETFSKVVTTLTAGIKGENAQDFTDEFEAYWSRLENVQPAHFNGNIGDNASIIKVGISEKETFFIGTEAEFLQSASRFFENGRSFTFYTGIHIPLKPGELIMPPKYTDEDLAGYIDNIIQRHTEPGVRKTLDSLLPKRTKLREYVLFSIKHNEGRTSLFGVLYTRNKSEKHPLAGNFLGKITPLYFTRLDKQYMYTRGSNGIGFKQRGLIVGGGSIGGYVAESLIRSGIFDLDIVDDDRMSTDNCYRHLLGFSDIGENKAVALKRHLEERFPHAHVNAHKKSIQALFSTGAISLSDYDFIVAATGNVTVNVWLNRRVAELKKDFPVLYVWNDPYGIGGHCLITNMGGQGCYECLYSNDERANSASFAHHTQSQPFQKTLSGCGGTFTPYSATDSVNSSLLAVRAVVGAFTRTITHNQIESWRGRTMTFTNEGYRLSPRYSMTDEQLNSTKQCFYQSSCKTCRGRSI